MNEEERLPYPVQLFVYGFLPTGLAAITLKVFNFVDWSWWWVLAPFWVPIALVLLLVILLAVFGRIKIIKK